MADEPIDEGRAVVEAAATAAVRAGEAAVRALQQRQPMNASRAEASSELRRMGADYDTPSRRAEREARVNSSEASPEAKRARITADKMNGTDPLSAASSRPSVQQLEAAKQVERSVRLAAAQDRGR